MTNDRTQEKEDGFKLVDYWIIFVNNWYWFLLSVLIAMGLAVLKILRTTPIYNSTTQLLIQDDKDGGSGMGGSIQDFSDLGLIKNNSNVNNEILTISAPIMMQQTVKRLQLDLQMSVKEQLHQKPLYNDAPVSLKLSAPLGTDISFAFTLTPTSRGEATLSEFKRMGKVEETIATTVKARFGQTVKTPIGEVTVNATPSWDDTFIGTPIYVNKYPVTAIGNMYAGRLAIGLADKEATVLNISIADEVPERGRDVLLTLIDVYNETWMKTKNRIAESTCEFINERLATITKELDDVDEQISDYKSSNLMPDVQAALTKDMQQSGKNFDNLLQLNNQLSMATFLRERLTDPDKANDLLPGNMGFSGSSLDQQITEYNRLMLDRSTYIENSDANSPAVVDLDRRLAAQKTAIIRSVDNLIAQLHKQVANVEKSDAAINSQIASNPQQAKVLNSVQRQQKVKESLYIFLLQKREENELSRTFTSYNSNIIQPPVSSGSPAAPRSKVIFLIALLIGMGIPGGIIFLLEMLNTKVRGRKDIENLDIPLIGELPDLSSKRNWWRPKKNGFKRSIVVEEGGKDLINEAMRNVRTSLNYLSENSRGKVIMFTSFNPNSGKSFISANMAKAFALKGNRVAVVDLDLRHRSLSQMCPTRSQGVSVYLNQHTDDLDDIIIKDAFGDNVDLVPVGIAPPNPTEVLQNGRLKQLLDALKERYDVVLLDCPPIEIVADANIIKDHADVTVFVIRVGVMDRRALAHVQDLYKEQCYNNFCLLLNGTKIVSSRLSSYHYGYTYGYSYSYGDYYQNKK
ncbi:MAG: GumC family protein [Alloprevotella sp.]